MPDFTDCSSSQQKARKHPTHSDKYNHPDNVSSPPPGLVPEVCWLPHRGCPQPAASLDIARVWRSPSAIAPAVTNRGYEEQKYECHPQNPPRAHRCYLAFLLVRLMTSRPVPAKLGCLALPIQLVGIVRAIRWAGLLPHNSWSHDRRKEARSNLCLVVSRVVTRDRMELPLPGGGQHLPGHFAILRHPLSGVAVQQDEYHRPRCHGNGASLSRDPGESRRLNQLEWFGPPS